MAAAILAAVIVLIGIAVVFMAVGCSQMPVTKGQYASDKVKQARIDSKQSDSIASMFNISYGMNGIIFQVAPEEAKPAIKGLETKISQEKAKADVQAAQGRERADLAEKEQEAVNAAPNLGQWASGVVGALGGNWSGLLDLVMLTLGGGGAAIGLRARSKAKAAMAEVVDGVERFSEEDPKQADRLKQHLSSAMDSRTKDLVREVKAKRLRKR